MIRVSSLLYDFLNILSKLTIKRLVNYEFNKHSYQLSTLLKKSINFSNPVSLSIEPTSFCNLKCPQCPTGLRALTRPQGYMDFTDFKKIIDETASHLLYLMLYFQGEPFLNKHIVEMIKYAHSKKIYVMTSTNAQTIDDTLAKKIVDSGLDKIIISMDGSSNQIFSRYRIGGELSKVINAISYITNYKKQVKSKKPFVEVQFLVLKHNEHEIKDAQKLAEQLNADKLSFKTTQIYDIANNAHLLPLNDKYSRYFKNAKGNFSLKKKIRNKCYKMWSSAVITWDGRLVPCCYDKDATYTFGNLKEEKLSTIWRSNDYNKFRDNILKNRKDIEMCVNCGE